MWERYSLVGIAFSLVIVFLDFYLFRKGKIRGRSFVIWLIVGAFVGLFSAVPPLFSLISLLFGTENIVNAIMAAGLLFLLLATFYLNYKISEIHSLLMKLTVEVSARKYTESHRQTKLEAKIQKKTSTQE